MKWVVNAMVKSYTNAQLEMPQSVKRSRLVSSAEASDMDDSRSLKDSDNSEDEDEASAVTHDLLLGMQFDDNEREHDLGLSHSKEVISGFLQDLDPEDGCAVAESANFFLRGVSLGAEAKPNERNILEIEVTEGGNKRISYTLASLTCGVQEMSQLNLDLTTACDAVLRLAHGTGPLCLTGLQEITYNFPSASDELKDSALQEKGSKGVSEEESSEGEYIEAINSEIPNKAIKRKIDQVEEPKKKVKRLQKNSKAAKDEETEESKSDSSDSNMEEEQNVSSKRKKLSKGKSAIGKSLSNKIKSIPKPKETLKDRTSARVKKNKVAKQGCCL